MESNEDSSERSSEKSSIGELMSWLPDVWDTAMPILLVVFSFLGIFVARLWGKDRRSFITGSQAYGSAYRTSDSDVDLIVWVHEDVIKELSLYTKNVGTSTRTSAHGPHVVSSRIKMGNFDLILVSEKGDFDHWKKITDKLKKESETQILTRERVVDAFVEDKHKSKILISTYWLRQRKKRTESGP